MKTGHNLTLEQRYDILQRLSGGEDVIVLAAEYGVLYSDVYRIGNLKTSLRTIGRHLDPDLRVSIRKYHRRFPNARPTGLMRTFKVPLTVVLRALSGETVCKGATQTSYICARCSRPFDSRVKTAKFCLDCRPVHRKEQQAEYIAQGKARRNNRPKRKTRKGDRERSARRALARRLRRKGHRIHEIARMCGVCVGTARLDCAGTSRPARLIPAAPRLRTLSSKPGWDTRVCPICGDSFSCGSVKGKGSTRRKYCPGGCSGEAVKRQKHERYVTKRDLRARRIKEAEETVIDSLPPIR